MGIERVRAAFEELKKFGQHEGECTFSAYCKLCFTPTGKCELHNSTMEKRIESMENAISELEDK